MNDDLRRYLNVLKELVGGWDGSMREIERRLGWATGRLTKVLAGRVELQVQDLLAILEVLGVEPLDFYRMAYGKDSVSEQVLRKISALSPQPQPWIFPAISEAELIQRIEAAVERAFANRDRLRNS